MLSLTFCRWVVTTSNLSADIVRAKGYGVDDNCFIYDDDELLLDGL